MIIVLPRKYKKNIKKFKKSKSTYKNNAKIAFEYNHKNVTSRIVDLTVNTKGIIILIFDYFRPNE